MDEHEQGAVPQTAAPSGRRRQDPTVHIRAAQPASRAWVTLVVAVGAVGVVVFGFGMYRFTHRNALAARPMSGVDRPLLEADAGEPTSATSATSAATDVGEAGSAEAAPKTETASAAGADAGVTGPFDRDAAHALLDALGPKLAGCKVPRGRSVKVKVTFAPDGHVVAAVVPPSLGQRACVTARLREVRVTPFDGGLATATQVLVAR